MEKLKELQGTALSFVQDKLGADYEKYTVHVCIAVIVVVLTLLWKLLSGSRPKDSPPRVYTGIPVVGNVLKFIKGPLKMIEYFYDRHGPVFTVPMMGQNLTFLIGPEPQAPFFKLKDDVLSQNEVYGFMKPVFGPGVVYDAEPIKRSMQMKEMANGLRTARLQSYVPMIDKEVREFIKGWGDSGTFDLLGVLSHLTILTASRCLHGNEIRDNMFEEVYKLYGDLDHGITPISFFFPNAPIPAHFKRNAAREKMCELFGSVIKARRVEKSKEEKLDMLQIFMDLEYKGGGGLSDQEVTGLLIALLFAGQHTSSISSTWTTVYACLHPKVLKRLQDEQAALVGGSDAPVTFEMLGNMEVLHNSMREVLRLWPPLIMLMRYAKQDFTVESKGKKYTIPKGDLVFTSPAFAMRLPEVFPNPNEFDPDRYTEPRKEHEQPFAYLGFGAGMHQCMGQQFGFLQVKTIMSILLRNYEIELVENKVPEVDYESMVAGPKGKIMATYKRRQSAK